MKQVCDELDKELSSDTDDVKSKRFDKVLDLMQQVRTCQAFLYNFYANFDSNP